MASHPPPKQRQPRHRLILLLLPALLLAIAWLGESSARVVVKPYAPSGDPTEGEKFIFNPGVDDSTGGYWGGGTGGGGALGTLVISGSPSWITMLPFDFVGPFFFARLEELADKVVRDRPGYGLEKGNR